MIITRQQVVDFIMSQPPEREVDFSENGSNEPCGCVMVDYGNANGIPFNFCGSRDWVGSNDLGEPVTVANLEGRYSDYQPMHIGGGAKTRCTYSEIQQLMKEKGWA